MNSILNRWLDRWRGRMYWKVRLPCLCVLFVVIVAEALTDDDLIVMLVAALLVAALYFPFLPYDRRVFRARDASQG